jgi:hypothetical protein
MRRECHALIRAALRVARSAKHLLEVAARAAEQDRIELSRNRKVVAFAKRSRTSRKQTKTDDRNSPGSSHWREN